MPKKSYGDLRQQMDTLIAQQQEMERKTADALVSTIMSSDAGAKLAALSAADLRAIARMLVDSLDGLIAKVQSDRQARKAKPAPAGPVRNVAQAPTPADDSGGPKRLPGFFVG